MSQSKFARKPQAFFPQPPSASHLNPPFPATANYQIDPVVWKLRYVFHQATRSLRRKPNRPFDKILPKRFNLFSSEVACSTEHYLRLTQLSTEETAHD